jgi:hypothetical protein
MSYYRSTATIISCVHTTRSIGIGGASEGEREKIEKKFNFNVWSFVRGEWMKFIKLIFFLLLVMPHESESRRRRENEKEKKKEVQMLGGIGEEE